MEELRSQDGRETEAKKLYQKLHALKTRVKKKQQVMWEMNSGKNSKADRLAELIFDELDCASRDQMWALMSGKAVKKGG